MPTIDISRSKRLQGLPPYIFSEINSLQNEALKTGLSMTSLGIGDPDMPTPEPIILKLREAIKKTKNHGYSPYQGTEEFRSAVASWMKQRFGVKTDPKQEILALIGSKEGIAHFPMAFCDPGDCCLVPSPGYPAFLSSAILSGITPIPFPLLPENHFLPDLNQLEFLILKHRPKYLVLNFPSNPTSVTCSRQSLNDIVSLALKNNVLILSDNAYSEIYFDATNKPPSILEIDGARNISIEFHSFSKTFNMAGWRIAFCVGNEKLVSGLLDAKTNIDSGPLLAVQEASVYALNHYDQLSEPIRKRYLQRRNILLSGLDRLGINYVKPDATFFAWARVPGNLSSMDFAKTLIRQYGLIVTPGIGFGKYGESFFRMALTVEPEEIERAIGKLSSFLMENQSR